MVKYRAMLWVAGLIVLASGVAVLAHEGDGVWRLVSPQALSGVIGGDDPVCKVKCANPNSCPGGAQFNCGSVNCSGSGACPTPNGTFNTTNKYCPACDLADSGQKNCVGGLSGFCTYTITCGQCQPPNMNGGSWYCATASQTGVAPGWTDMGPIGAACP